MKTAYPQNSNVVSIRLYSNIPFDNTYKNHSLISEKFKYNNTQIYSGSGMAKEEFINRSKSALQPFYYPRYDLTGEFNFDFKNGLIGSITLELTPAQTNANYMRVKVGDATHGYEYYYYFITSINQSNVDTYVLTLECDVLMTYQDEFLDGMKDIPAFTSRKHCHRYTNNGLLPYCPDLKTGEDAFANVKPSLLNSKIQLNYENTYMKNIKDLVWLYICLDIKSVDESTINMLYTCQSKDYPLVMVAIPINVATITYSDLSLGHALTFENARLKSVITGLIDDGSVHGAKISPYPPFVISSGAVTTLDNSRNLAIRSSLFVIREDTTAKIYQMSIGGNLLIYGYWETIGDNKIKELLSNGALLVTTQNVVEYPYEGLKPSSFGITNASAPTINSNRYTDPKLLFSPFKKYKLSAQYANEGNEFYPELIFSENSTGDTNYFYFATTTSAYIGDNNFFTFLKTTTTHQYYRYDKIGLSSAVNYIMPCGTNALDIFNSTQAQSFYTSKVASGITSGLSLVGGIASIGIGAGMTIGSSGSLSPMGIGLMASGAMAIAGGTASVATTIASANAKIEDLKNTPDSVNVSGSNFITDNASAPSTYGLPYILVYDVTCAIKENANDFFYNYGYQVARECYFNTELKFDNSTANNVDNNMFGRTIFNYIQLNEDITNKINTDIPLVVKQKLSKIFNDGITLWSFFGNAKLWKGQGGYPLSTDNPDNWFMKCILDNTEYSE